MPKNLPTSEGFWWITGLSDQGKHPECGYLCEVIRMGRKQDLWFIAPAWSCYLPVKQSQALEFQWHTRLL